jgi:hypothetical protein
MNSNLLRLCLGITVAGAVAATTVVAAQGDSDDRSDGVSTRLSGYNEDPLALSTTARGSFSAKVDKGDQEIDYRLSYNRLEGTVQQAHLHFGGKAQSGGISVFLCSNLGNGPTGTQACPPSGTVRGTITPEDVIGPAAQGIAPEEFTELVKAIRADKVYVNVHSSLYPGGEIRGQLD